MIKKIFTTLLIILGICVGAVAVCVGVMVMFPNVSLFGFNYVKDNVNGTLTTLKYSSQNQDFLVHQINSISIDMDKYDLIIERNPDKTDETIQVQIYSSFVGLLRADENGNLYKTINIVPTFDYKTEDKFDVSLKATEPRGIIIPSKMLIKIRLAIPEDYEMTGIDTVSLNIKNANLTISDNIKKVQAKKVVLSKENTTKSINTGKLVATDNLTLNVNNGRMDLTKSTDINTNVNINTRGGTFVFGDVKTLNVQSETNPYITVNGNVAGQLKYVAKSGSLKVGTVSNYTTIQTDSASLEFDKVKGPFIASNYKGDSKCNSNIKIGTIEKIQNASADEDKINLESGDGNITIDKIYRNANITTNNGAITIGNDSSYGVDCDKLVIETERGQVKAYFNGNRQVKTQVKITSNKSGLISVYNIDPASESFIKSMENTEIYAEFAGLTVDDFKLQGRGKKITAVVPTAKRINLTLATDTKATIDIKVMYINRADEIKLNKNNIDSFEYDSVDGLAKIEDKFGVTYTNSAKTGSLGISNNSDIYVLTPDAI